ncbi:MAG: PfkB family carbohydrate kinase [Bacteroidota bacterium]|nr:PfkB family carbohydrate kinase [Bacteroidota bacterium]
MSLLVVGTVAFDALETPFGKTDRILGGSATYFSLSASRFVKPINLVSVVGEDLPQEHLDLLTSNGVDIRGVEIVKGGKTFFWSGKYHNDMNTRDTLVTELNVLADFQPELPQDYREPEVLMLGNLDPKVQLAVIDQIPRRPKVVVLDTMNFWMDHTMDDLKKVLRKVDVLTINDEEARQLSGEYSLVKAAKKIMNMGPLALVIKKGEHGALLFHDSEVFFAPALPLEEVFDPTGAGDTFAGGFTGYLASSKDISFENMKRAVIYGSAMASFCVEKFGTERLEKITDKELRDRVSAFLDLTQIEMVMQ